MKWSSNPGLPCPKNGSHYGNLLANANTVGSYTGLGSRASREEKAIRAATGVRREIRGDCPEKWLP
jgi:hypothetical protein